MNYHKLANTIAIQENFDKYFGEAEILSVSDLIFQPGFIQLMLTIWSPVIISGLIVLLINHLHRKEMKK